MKSLEKLENLINLHLGISQDDNRQLFDILGKLNPMEIKSFRSGSEHNGWVVPSAWKVKQAKILFNGQVVFDGTVHPLAVAQHSCSYSGKINKAELDKHVITRKDLPDAYPFHWRFSYRPWLSDWAFCVPYASYSNWQDGEYEIILETVFEDGEMLVGTYSHVGESKETILFNAHSCHPCQVNDDLAGVFLIAELFQWLSTQETKYSYLGVIGPEFIGSVFYLRDLNEEIIEKIKLGCFVEMIATSSDLSLQKSFNGNSIIDRVANHVLLTEREPFTTGDFATVAVNDELIWEGPGIEIPMISLSRWPYPYYHTNEDNISNLHPENAQKYYEIIKQIIFVLEEDCTMERNYDGLLALSNPKYDLYVNQPGSLGGINDKNEGKFARLQDYIQRYFDGRHSVFQIAEKFDLPFKSVLEYVTRFEQKGLIKFKPVGRIDFYNQGSAL